MTILRILAGVVSLGLALLLGAAAGNGFWDEFVVHPKTSDVNFDFMEVGGFTLVDWQIRAFYGTLGLFALMFGLFAAYVLWPRKKG